MAPYSYFLVVALLTTLALGAPTNSSNNANERNSPPNELLIDDRCVSKCKQDMYDRMQKFVSGEVASTLTNSYDLTGFLNLSYETLDQVCLNAYRPIKECFRTCSDNKMKTVAIRSLSMMDYICFEKFEEFKESLFCTSNANFTRTAQMDCKTEMQRLIDIGNAGSQKINKMGAECVSGKKEECFTDTFTELCEASHAAAKCTLKVLPVDCNGVDMQKFCKGLYEKMIGLIKLVFDDDDAALPSTCQKFHLWTRE